MPPQSETGDDGVAARSFRLARLGNVPGLICLSGRVRGGGRELRSESRTQRSSNSLYHYL